MPRKTFKAAIELAVEVPDELLTLPSSDFDAQLDAILARDADVIHHAEGGLKQEARDWARGLWSANVKKTNQRTSKGADMPHQGLRQPERDPKLPFA